MLVLGEPDQPCGWPQARNICITDNQALARYLIDAFVANMAWQDIGAPFAVEARQDQSSTGTHEMVSIFLHSPGCRCGSPSRCAAS